MPLNPIASLLKKIFAKPVILVGGLIAVTAYLSLMGLAHHMFWDDEAYVAILARNLIQNHKLTGWQSYWDGRNLLTYRNERVLEGGVSMPNPPLDRIITAVSFKLLGPSTFTARLPFVLLGLASIFVLYLILHKHFSSHKRILFYALPLYAFSYSFLLNIRQCRYYAPALLFTLLAYYFYRRILAARRKRHAVFFSITLILLFLSNYLFCVSFAGALLITHLVLHRSTLSGRDWITAAIIIALFAVPMAMYALRFKIWIPVFTDVVSEQSFRKHILLYWHFRELDMMGYLPLLLVLPGIVLCVVYRKKTICPRPVFEWLMIILWYVVILSILSPQEPVGDAAFGGLANVRYLVILLPFSACTVGAILALLHAAYGGMVSVALSIIVLCTNIFSLNIAYNKFRWLLPAYVTEIHNDYTTPYEAVVGWLEANAPQNDTVYTYPEYAMTSLLFYVGDKVKLGGLLTHKTDAPLKAVKKLDAPIFIEDYFPQWLVFFSVNSARQDRLRHFSRGQYEYKSHKRIDVFWKDMTRPELPWHSFVEPKLGNPGNAIHILKRTAKGTPAK